MFPFAAPQLPSVVSAPFTGVLDGVLKGVLNSVLNSELNGELIGELNGVLDGVIDGEPGTDTWVSDIAKDAVDAVVAPSEDNDNDGDGDENGNGDAGFGNCDDDDDDDCAFNADEVLMGFEVATKEVLVVVVPELEVLESNELAIVFRKLVGKIGIELLLPTIGGVLRDGVINWDEEPEPEELTIEEVMTLDGALIAFEVLDEDTPVVDVTEVEVLETNGLIDVLMELVAKVEIELPLLAIEGVMEDKMVDWDEVVEPEVPVLWADATLVEKDRPLLERTDEEELKAAS